MKSKKKVLLNIVIVFLIVFIPKMILCLRAIPVSTLSDEVATMSAGAYVAGLDWSQVISHAGYYGGGMTIFTAPFYLLIDDPIAQYRLTGVFCAALQSIPAVIAYLILKKTYSVSDKKAIWISIACGFFVMSQANVIYNEHALILVSWLISWLILALHQCGNSKKKRLIYTLLLMFLLDYSLTLHTRSVTYWLCLGILIICYKWRYRRWLISLPVAAAAAIAGWKGAQTFIEYFRYALWHIDNGGAIRNSSINMSGGLENLFHLQDIRAWLSIIIGQIHTLGVFTGGIIFIFICLFVTIVMRFLFGLKYREVYLHDRAINNSIPLIIFFLSAVIVTIAGQSISWLGGTIVVYHGGVSSQEYGVKAFTYLRYFGIYCGPLLLVGLIWLSEKREEIFHYLKPAWIMMILLEIYWVICIVPYIHLCSEWGVFEYYYPYTWFSPNNPARYLAFLPASVAMFLILGLVYFLLKKGKTQICIILLICLLLNSYCYRVIKYDYLNAEITYAWADDGFKLIKSIENKVELPSIIYVEDLWEKEDHFNFYLYQFMLNRYTIIPERPQSDVAEAILFSNGSIEDYYYDELFEQGYKCAEIGDYELLFVKGENLQEAFRDQGIDLMVR